MKKSAQNAKMVRAAAMSAPVKKKVSSKTPARVPAKAPVKSSQAKKAPVKAVAKAAAKPAAKAPVKKAPAKAKAVAKATVRISSKAPVKNAAKAKSVAGKKGVAEVKRKMTLAEVRAAAAAKVAEAKASGHGRRIRKTDAERMEAPVRKLAAKAKARKTVRKRIAAQMADAAAERAAQAEKAPEPFIKPPAKKTVRFSDADLEDFRRKLVSKRKDIVSKLASSNRASFRREDESHRTEESTEAYERFLAIGANGSFQQDVYQIDEALEAIKNGTYGICKNCGGLIQKPRLLAIPFAKNCIRCQSLHERRK